MRSMSVAAVITMMNTSITMNTVITAPAVMTITTIMLTKYLLPGVTKPTRNLTVLPLKLH